MRLELTTSSEAWAEVKELKRMPACKQKGPETGIALTAPLLELAHMGADYTNILEWRRDLDLTC